MASKRVTLTMHGINDRWVEFRSLSLDGSDRTKFINSLIEQDRVAALEDQDTADRWEAFCKAVGIVSEA